MGGVTGSLKKWTGTNKGGLSFADLTAEMEAEAKKEEGKQKLKAVEEELQRRFRTVMGLKGGGGRRPMLLEGVGGETPTEGYLAVQAREREAALAKELAKEREARKVAWNKYQEERRNQGESAGMYSTWEREVYGNRI